MRGPEHFNLFKIPVLRTSAATKEPILNEKFLVHQSKKQHHIYVQSGDLNSYKYFH